MFSFANHGQGREFIAIEDESGIANLLVWVKTFEKQRRIVLGAGMLGAYGRIQREGDVVHLVAHRLTDLSSYLGSVMRHERANAGGELLDLAISSQRKSGMPSAKSWVRSIKGMAFWGLSV